MPVPRAELERRMNRFVEGCRRSGMKLTHQRTEIFREVGGSDEHPDAETVYQQVRKRVTGISRDTVYRTLASLEAQGLVRKAEVLFDRGRFEANTDRHHHFVCTECGLVRDFYSEPLNDLPIPKSVQTMGSIQATHVQVRGICQGCSSKHLRRKNPKDKEPTHGE